MNSRELEVCQTYLLYIAVEIVTQRFIPVYPFEGCYRNDIHTSNFIGSLFSTWVSERADQSKFELLCG